MNELLFCKLISNTIYMCVCVRLHVHKYDVKCNFCPPQFRSWLCYCFYSCILFWCYCFVLVNGSNNTCKGRRGPFKLGVNLIFCNALYRGFPFHPHVMLCMINFGVLKNPLVIIIKFFINLYITSNCFSFPCLLLKEYTLCQKDQNRKGHRH